MAAPQVTHPAHHCTMATHICKRMVGDIYEPPAVVNVSNGFGSLHFQMSTYLKVNCDLFAVLNIASCEDEYTYLVVDRPSLHNGSRIAAVPYATRQTAHDG